MHLIYLTAENRFVLYDNYHFVGLAQEKKHWHFTRQMPKNIPEILADAGFAVCNPTEGVAPYARKRKLLKTEAVITVCNTLDNQNVEGKGRTWVEALNDLAARLPRK